jgi:hypothetical protein
VKLIEKYGEMQHNGVLYKMIVVTLRSDEGCQPPAGCNEIAEVRERYAEFIGENKVLSSIIFGFHTPIFF